MRVGLAVIAAVAVVLVSAMPTAAIAHDAHKENSQAHSPAAPARFASVALTIPDVEVIDQDGRALKFNTDLVKGRTVAVNFIFTTCRTTCPMLTATFAAVQEAIGERLGSDIFLISVTLDPENDTPFELHAYAEKFGARKGWSFITGKPADIAALLKAFNANASALTQDDHTSIALIGNGTANSWSRASGLHSAPAIAAALRQAAAAARPDATLQFKDNPGAASYFTNLPLIDQRGQPLRFYDDVVHGGLVVILSFFTSCADVCPLAVENLRAAEALLAAVQGMELRIVAISVDADNDTPEKLRAFASDHGLGERWTLLTGKKENVDWVLHKLGLYPETPADHDTRLLIGNDRTGAWLKLWVTSPPNLIARSIVAAAAALRL